MQRGFVAGAGSFFSKETARFSCFFGNPADFLLTALYLSYILYMLDIHSIVFGRCTMDIIISNSGGVPIYDQITRQVKGLILRGELREGEALPSMRLLAKELRISVITTKRAYEELEREGFLTTVPGKGCFVAPRNLELVREDVLRRVEEHLTRAVEEARTGDITLAELTEILTLLYGDEQT